MHFRRYDWAILWSLGVVLGWCAAFAFPFSGELLADSVVAEHISYPASLLTLLLPLLLSALAVSLFGRGALYPIIPLKGFSYAYCTFGVVSVFGGAGWLASLLLLFPEHLLAPVLLWFWQRAGKAGFSLRNDFFLCAVISVAVGTVYIFVILPVLSASIS